MPLSIDTSIPLLRPSQLQALVRAVQNGHHNDETRSIEWKSRLDLASAVDQGNIARHILGFANREPIAASQRFGGYAYLLVGVEPGQLYGVESVDSAKLLGQLRRYLGPALRWTPEWINVDGFDVLVIIVDPPTRGDRIYCLHKQIDAASKGTDLGKAAWGPGAIFVRHTGRTDPANVADVEMLQERLSSTEGHRIARERVIPAAILGLLLLLLVITGPLLEAYFDVYWRPSHHSRIDFTLAAVLSITFWFACSASFLWVLWPTSVPARSGMARSRRTIVIILAAALTTVGVAIFEWDVARRESSPNNTIFHPGLAEVLIILNAMSGVLIGVSVRTGRWLALPSMLHRKKPT